MASNNANSANINNSPNAKMNKGTNKWKNAQGKVGYKISNSRNNLSRMSSFKKLWILFLFILVVIILVYWGKSISYSSSWKSKYEPMLIKCPMNAYDPALTKQSKVLPNSDQGLAFTYSFWIYISDWNYNFGKFKNILQRGNDNVGYSPGIWLYPNTNALHARISTYADPNEGCDIQNIPLQKWCHIVYMLNTRTVDIYINGKLERSCVLKGVPNVNNQPLQICQHGGYYGQISRLQYFAKTINPNKIKQIYRQGPFGSTKYKVQFFRDGKFVTTTPDES
jgi:hypothetical protein